MSHIAMLDLSRWSLALWASVCPVLCTDVTAAQARAGPQVALARRRADQLRSWRTTKE